MTASVKVARVKLIALSGLLTAALGGLVFYDNLRKRVDVADAQMPVIPVVVEPARQETVPSSIAAVGTIVADKQVLVATEVAGRISALRFESGSSVKAGDLLLQVNDAPQRKELERYQAAARLAGANLDRATRLQGKSMSRAEFDQHAAEHAQSMALVAQAQEEVRLRSVHAPFDGLLGIRQVNLGQFVEAGTPVVSLTDPSTLHVDFSVPDRYRSQLSLGARVELFGEAADMVVGQARITSIDPLLDRNHRAVQVRASIDPPAKSDWWPGKFVRVEVQRPDQLPELSIPAAVVQASLAGDSVYVIATEADRAIARLVSIKAGARYRDRVSILDGDLQDGDLVVVAGQINLSDRAVVKVRLDDSDAVTASIGGED